MAGRVRRSAWGTVRKLPSGRWQARWPDPERAGVLVPAEQTFPTPTDAGAWLAARRTDVDRGVVTRSQRTARTLTVADAITAYLERRPSLSPKYRQESERFARLHLTPHLGDLPLGRLTPAVVADWWAARERELPESGTGRVSRYRALELLRSVCRELAEFGTISASPVRAMPKPPRPAERAGVSVEQVRAVADAVPERLRVAVLLAAGVGLRAGELLGLTWADVDLAAGVLHVRQQRQRLDDGTTLVRAPKTAAGRRSLPMPGYVVEAVAAHHAAYPGLPAATVLTGRDGRPLTWRALDHAYTSARDRAGVPDTVRLHDLRAHSLTTLAVAGATIGELMAAAGHTSPGVAVKYQRVAADRQTELAARVDASWRKAAGR